MIEISLKNCGIDIQIILCCNIFTEHTVPGDGREFIENITTANISHSTVFKW